MGTLTQPLLPLKGDPLQDDSKCYHRMRFTSKHGFAERVGGQLVLYEDDCSLRLNVSDRSNAPHKVAIRILGVRVPGVNVDHNPEIVYMILALQEA